MNRVVTGVLLLIVGLIGLFMTLCGGWMTGMFVMEGITKSYGAWVISVPSFLVGVGILFLVRKWGRQWLDAGKRP